MSAFEIALVLSILASNFARNGADVIRLTTSPTSWDDSILHCKQTGEELITPLTPDERAGFINNVTTEAGHFWTGLIVTANHEDTLGWGGIHFYENVSSNMLPWKPGKRPTAADVDACVAVEVTKLSVAFYPESCSELLLSYCRTIDATSYFSSYSPPLLSENATDPFQSFGGILTVDACAYECLESDECLTYTYLAVDQLCLLYNINNSVVENNTDSTWTIDKCKPLAAPEHSSPVPSDNAVGDTVDAVCLEEYENSTTTCQSNGRWTNILHCYREIPDCALGDIAHTGVCYRFSSSPKNWNDAKIECQGHDGYLLEIKDEERMLVVNKMLALRPNETFWTGASDIIQDAWWHWTTEYTSLTYTNWHAVSGDPTGHCVQLRRTWGTSDQGEFFFDDQDCSEERHFICEIGSVMLRTDITCDDDTWCRGLAQCAGKCYCFSPNRRMGDDEDPNRHCARGWNTIAGFGISILRDYLPQDISQEACKREGGSLMAPVTERLNRVLTEFYIDQRYEQGYYFWSSLKTLSPDVYEDIGMNDFGTFNTSYLPWRLGFETELYTPGDCLVTEISKAGVKLIECLCSRKRPGICLKISAPARFTDEGTKLVSEVPMVSMATSSTEWCGAECLTHPSCSSYGYSHTNHTCHLYNLTAAVDNDSAMEVQIWGKTKCPPLSFVKGGRILTGANVSAVGTDVTYECDQGYNNVTSLTVTCGPAATWSDLPYCQPNGPACPASWTRLGTSCYLLVETELSWTSATQHCELQTGYLVELDDEAEHQFIINFLDFDMELEVWTGGHDIGMQHWYRWYQYPYEDMTVIDWFPGDEEELIKAEPTGFREEKNDVVIYEDCIQLRKIYEKYEADRYYYSDEECGKPKMFICETKVLNVGGSGCDNYTDNPCKGVAKCELNICRCPYDTHRQIGPDDDPMTNCYRILPIGTSGCMEHDPLCHNISVCGGDNKCVCPSPLNQNGQDHSFSTNCVEQAPQCFEEWRGLDTMCYKMISSGTDKDINADQECIKIGSLLASATSPEINDFLLDLGKRANKWIGLHGREGEFQWADGTLLSSYGNFSVFAPGNDSMLLVNESCVYLSMQGTWIVENCDESRPSAFICSLPNSCTSPPDIANANIEALEDLYEVGTVLEYTCNYKYVLEGTHTGKINCRLDPMGLAFWDPPPTCVAMSGGVFGDLDGENYGLVLGSATSAPTIDECAQLCFDNIQCLAFSFSPCQAYSQISNTLGPGFNMLPANTMKKRKECPPLPRIKDAELTATDRRIGSAATYICLPMTYLIPGRTSVVNCQSNGQWEEFPECKDRFKDYDYEVEATYGQPSAEWYFSIPTLAECKLLCIKETSKRCIALRYQYGECFLYADRIQNITQKGLAKPATYTVYSELIVADLNEFNTYFDTSVTLTSANEVLGNVSMEECAQTCINRTDFDCQTIMYYESMCELFEETADGNMVVADGHFVFKRNMGCANPVVPSGMSSIDVIRKKVARYSVGDSIQFTCANFGENFLMHDGKIYCQPGGTWTRHPKCRNLCTNGWAFNGGSCYQVFDDLQTFDNANIKCASNNASLLNIEMEDEREFVNKMRLLMGLESGSFWIGLYADLQLWTWTVGHLGNTSALGVNLPSVVNDAAIVYDFDALSLASQPRTNPHRYVCKKALPNLRCPDDWYYHNRTCYKGSGSVTAATYQDAVTACSSSGHMLATPHSVMEIDFIKLVSNLSGNVEDSYIGLQQLSNQDWTYVDGSPQDFAFATGIKGLNTGEKCLVVSGSAVNVSSCTEPRPYVCQVSLGETGLADDYDGASCATNDYCQEAGLHCVKPTVGGVRHPPTCRPLSCPPWMKYLRGKCFHVSSDIQFYFAATASCGGLGARIVSIDSMRENFEWLEIFESQVGTIKGFWVGEDRLTTESRFKTNPLDSSFDYWVWTEEPDTYDPVCIIHSAHLDSLGRWLKAGCTGQYNYICEKDITLETNSVFYKGCYNQTFSPFHPLQVYKDTFLDNDITVCRDHCTFMGYKYAAALGTECSCGNMYAVNGRVEETKCSTACPGNTDEKCGGPQCFSVYETTGDACSLTMPTSPDDPNRCYSVSTDEIHWFSAQYTCGRNGGDLIRIQNLRDQNFFFRNLLQEPGRNDSRTSIGTYTLFDTGAFNYYTGTESSQFQNFFSKFTFSNIKETTYNLDCVSVDSDGRWIHQSCSKNPVGNFVCEFREKNRHPVGGNMWTRMRLESYDADDSSTSLVKVTGHMFSQRGQHLTLTSNTTLYSKDLDLGCLNDRSLCPDGFTLTLTLSIDTTSTSDIEIISTGDCVSNFAVGAGFCIFYKTSTAQLVINDASENNPNKFVNLPMIKGQWYHIAIVFDGADKMLAYLDGANVQEFSVNTLQLKEQVLTSDAVMFGNWHHVTQPGSSFKLHDVRFKPEKIMRRELLNIVGSLALDQPTGFSHWLEDDLSHIVPGTSLSDPGIDGQGMRLTHQGAVEFISDNGHTCLANLDQCTSDFSLSFWVNLHQESYESDKFQTLFTTGDVSGGKVGLEVKLTGIDLHIDLAMTTGQYSINVGSLTKDTWHNIILDYTTSSSLTVYRDGGQMTVTPSGPPVSAAAPMSTIKLGQAKCPPGWVYSGTSCYYFDSTTGGMFYHALRAEKSSAHIVHVDSDEEIEFLSEFMDSNGVTEVVMATYNEAPTAQTRFVRLPGGPEPFLPSTGNDYQKLRCTATGCSTEGLNLPLPAVYEIELDQPDVGVKTACPDDWQYFEDSCYLHLSSVLESGASALEKCAEVFATPVAIETEEELRFVANLAYRGHHDTTSSWSFLAGGSRETLADGTERYVNRYWRELEWSSWYYREVTTNLTCLKVQCESGGCFFVDIDCDVAASHAVCERDAATKCGVGWRQIGNRCYEKYEHENITSDYCEEHGYNLAVIDDLQLMERMLYDLNIGSAMCLTDAFLSGANYTWNSTGQVTYFDRELTTKTEQCVTLSNDSPKRGLTPNCDINCVICQRDITLDVSLDNIQFHERLLTAAERTNILTTNPTTPKQLSCPMAPVDIISSSSVTCMLDGATVTMTGSGAIETVADHLYKESVTLGDGISGTISGNLLNVTSAKLGITVAFWVYVFPNSSSLMVDSIGTGDSGVQISYTHRSLMAEVMEPNFVWNAKTWFPVQDWTYVTLTWQEAIGLSLYINGDLMSKVKYGTPLHGFNTNPSSSNTLQIAQHGEGDEIRIKDFIYTDVVWSARQIGNFEYGATDLKYLITFDEEYQPGFDNLVMTRNESLTSLVWRNSLFQHSLYVDNMAGQDSLPAAMSLGQMRNCFTRLESCKSSWSLSFWLQPINFQNPQTYITAYTPSLTDQVRSIAWELTYNNTYDVFELIFQREKIRLTFTFKLDFREWSFLHIGMLSATEHKLYVNGIEQAEPMRTHVANYIEPTQPFSYLEIGSYGHFEIDDIRFYGLPMDPYGYYILKSCLLYELAGLRGQQLNLQVGTSFSDMNTTLCNLTGDYNGLSVTFEQENMDNLTAQGISLDYTASNSYQEGINGQSLHLANSGLTLTGADSDCFHDLTECRLGFSAMMWLKLEIISTKIQIFELGGQPLTSFPGLGITCESIPADSQRVLCISEASSQDVSWQSSFKVQKNRWVHLAVTWNQLLGMSVHLNGHDIAEFGEAVVTSGVALGSITSPSDIKIGHSSAFSDVGTWSVDDIWLIERDVSLPEIREHFGDKPACVDGWVYNDVTGLCYNITKGTLLSSQEEAEDHCQKFGGRLAIEPDADTHTWLKDNILVPSGVTSFVHIGLAKTGQEGTIRRSDGQLASHLPTLTSPTTTYVCVVLRKLSWVYIAKNCHFTAEALCQRPPLWLPNKEISIATENPRFNYTELSTVNTPNIMEGIVGDTIDFTNNYVFEEYADECINNIHFCHNGWSLSAWLHVDPPLNSSAQEVIYSSVGTSNSYGVTVYGHQDGEFHYINVIVDDSQNKTSTKFEISTHTWMHLYIALSLNTSDITVIFNGLNNTYIEAVKTTGTGVVPDIGTLLPFSIGADSLGGKQMVGMIDELEVFEHELLDLEEIFLKVSEQHNKSIIVEQNFDFSDMIKNSAFASKLPGKFGYASFIVKNKPITHIGQFAFDCFGSVDMCTNGFTIIMWIQPQGNQSDTDFGIVSAINNHRGFKISYFSSHPIYTSEPPSYWFTVRDGTKEYDIPFQMPEWYWSFILFTWRPGQPNLFINSKKMTVVKTQALTGDSYPVVLLHFGKSDDRVTCLEGFSGGVDDFLFWPEDVTDEKALVLYRERVYVEETIKWNTTASALPGNHLTLTSLTDALDLTANVNANSCFLKSTSCFFGITASIMIRFLDLNDHDQMIFTTGGETDDGSGLYLRLVPNNSSMPFRRYFHLGAKTEDKEFLVVFHLRYNQWTQIIAEFSPKFSLKVFVDKLFVGEDFGTARTVGSSGSDGRLLIGKHTEVVTELPNFEIQHFILWDKAVDASRKGLVEDFMHYVHKSMDLSSDWTMIGTMTYSECLNQCLSDNITECNTFSYCPSIVEGDCYLLADQLLDTDLVTTDQCDVYIPVKMPYIDYFTSCISMTTIASLTVVAEVADWEECRQICYVTGSRYAGIYEGTKCYCDDALGTQTPIPTTNCNIDCSTISSETCGGTTSVSVYSCGSLQPLIAPTVPITSIVVALNPGVYVSIGETISLAMSVNEDTFAGYFISTEAMAENFYTGFNVTEITVNKIGQFTLNVRALNEISYKDFVTTIYIFLPIDDIDTDYKDFAATNEEVAFTATVTNGTNITCEIFFGDGNSDSLFQSDDSVPFVFKHTYLSDGVYNVNITCFNSITTITDEGSIVIQDVITNPLMTTNEPLQHPDPLAVNWTIDKGTNTTFTLFLDDVETNLESYIFGSLTGTASIPQSLYSRTGEHNLVLRATNLVSQEFFNTTVRIEIPVETVTVTPNGTFHVVGGPVHFAVTIAKGSNMTIELHLDDTTTVDLTSSSNDFNHAISYVHEYSYVGTVEVNITATNIHGAVSNVCTVILETTVADVVITAPDIYNPVDYDLEVIFEVDLPSEVPTNALIDVTFGDSNSVSDVVCDMLTLQQIISHSYDTHGTYAINVMIYNNASTKSFTRNVQVGGPIANLTVNLNRLYVPHGTPLITTSDVDYGSLITYSYEFGDGTSETRNYTRNYPTAVDVYQHVFPNTLIYGVNITASNSYNSEMQSFFVHVQEKVEGLVLVSNAPVRVNTTMTFYLAMVEAGTDTCFVWDFDDGKKMLYGVPSCPLRPEYENLEFEPVSGIIHAIEHTYQVEGSYNVSVNSSNEVSWDFVTLSVTSLEFLCIEPEVDILGFTYNGISPVTMLKSNRFKVSANIDTQCIPPVNAVFEWRIQEVNVTGNVTNQDIAYLQEISPPTNGLPELTIPKGFLEYGVYKVSLTVSYEKGTDLSSTDFAFVEVGPSMLVALLAGDYFQKAYVGANLKLDASKSYDPDMNKGTSKGLWFKWYCRLENENFVVDANGLPVDVLTTSSPGCFGDGFGYLGNSSATFEIPSSDLVIESLYVFALVIGKDDRVNMIEQRVEIISTELLPITMRCVDNCGIKTTRNQPLRLASVCQDCSPVVTVNAPYLWELFVIHDDESYQQVNITYQAPTGVEGPNLMLEQDLLDPGTVYRVRLTSDATVTERQLLINYPPYGGWCNSNRRIGMELETKFIIHCEGWLDEGTRSEPNPDTDQLYQEPISFKFLYKVRGTTSDPHVFYEVTGTQVQTPEVVFRGGLESEDYEIDIYIEVSDSGGAQNYTDLSIRVIGNPDFIMEVYKGNNYKRFEAEKDISALLVINLGVIEKLNELQNNTNTSHMVTMQMVESVAEHVAEHIEWVETPYQVELVVDILEQVLDQPEELSPQSQANVLNTFDTMFGVVDRIFNESADSVTQQKVSKDMMNSFVDLMMMNTFTSNCESASCESNRELSEATYSVFESRDSVVGLMLQGAVAGEPPILITRGDGEFTYQLERSMTSHISNTSVDINGKELVTFPDLNKLIKRKYVDVELIESVKLQPDINDTVQTRVSSVTLFDKGEKVKVNISSDSELIKVNVYSPEDINTETIDLHNNSVNPFFIQMSLNRSDVTLIFDLQPEDTENATFAYFVGYNSEPSYEENELNGTMPLEDENEADKQWRLTFDLGNFSSESRAQSYVMNTPSVYVGLLALHNVNDTSSAVNLTVYTAGCQYWDSRSSRWLTRGLSYGRDTNTSIAECQTNHLTSFGASFFVPPNTIDFKSVFNKFSDIGNNAAVFATVIAVIVLYFIIVFLVRRADKKDVEKWSVVPMLDNLPSDVYHYQVSVFTGMRRHAGTKSKVFFVLGGEDGDTEIRALEADGKRHERGSVNSFILSVPQGLGHLLFLRIWHDNAGKSLDSDWYLSLVMVKDLQTDEKSVFLCDRWLALDKDDGKIERFLPVSTKEDLESFGHLFSFQARQDLTDGHLWFSVASRPTWSNFTRVQRLSCCLSLLFTTMIANAMWYGTQSSEGTQDVHLGPFTFSPQELTTSLMMSLIVVPINLLIVHLFRKAGPKPKKPKKFKHPESGVELPRVLSPSGIFTVEDCQRDAKIDPETLPGDARKTPEPRVISKSSKSKRRCCMFPYWVAYIAWFLVFLSVVVPAFFCILYSLEWGAEKSSRWLTTFILSFLESVVLVQPVKVLAVAIVLSLIFRKMEFEEKAPAEEQEGETITFTEPGRTPFGNYAHPMKPAHRRPYIEKPPDFSTIDKVRDYRKKQNRLIDIVKDIGSYVFYLVIVAIICYENRDEKSFLTVDNIKNQMVKDIKIPGSPDPIRGFEGVSSFDNFWEWSVERLVPALYVEKDFNDESVPANQQSLLSDRIHYRVGPPRLRQARVEPEPCKNLGPLTSLIRTCIAEYGVTNYDDESFSEGWTDLNTSSTGSPTPWQYQTVMNLGGIPSVGDFGTYGGGGYVAVLGNTNDSALDMIKHLKDNKWLDRQTRAVFLEVNLYNPFVNLFCAVSLLLEVPPTGSGVSYTRITPLRLYRYVGPSALFMIVTDIIFVAFTCYFLIRLIKELKVQGRKFLSKFWNYIEFFNVLAAILCCAFYGVHYIMTYLTINDFHDHPGEFVNFQRIVLWDDVFAFMQGFLLFFSMIKLLRLIRFNAKVTQLSTTLKKSVGPLFNFMIVFLCVFLAFTQFAYLVFGPTSSEYFSFLTSLETLFSMLLMKVNIEQVMTADSVLGPIFLFLFILMVVFVLLNMLLSILNDVFTKVRLDKRCRPDDPEMVNFMIQELKRVVGISEAFKGGKGKTSSSKIQPSKLPLHVERWLAAENDNDGPEMTQDGCYEKITPPHSTGLGDLTKKELYKKQSKDWLKAYNRSTDEA